MNSENPKLSPRRLTSEAKPTLRDRLLFSVNKEIQPPKNLKKPQANSFVFEPGTAKVEITSRETSLVELRNDPLSRKIHSSLHNNELRSLPLYQLKDLGTSVTLTRLQNRAHTPHASPHFTRNGSRPTHGPPGKNKDSLEPFEAKQSLTDRKTYRPIDEIQANLSNDYTEKAQIALLKGPDIVRPKGEDQANSFNTCPAKSKNLSQSKLNNLILKKLNKPQVSLYNDPPQSSHALVRPNPKKKRVASKNIEPPAKFTFESKKRLLGLKNAEPVSKNPGLNLYEKMQNSTNGYPYKAALPKKPPTQTSIITDEVDKNPYFKTSLASRPTENAKGRLFLSKQSLQPQSHSKVVTKVNLFSVQPANKFYSNNESDNGAHNKESEKATVKNGNYKRMLSPHSSSLDRFSMYPIAFEREPEQPDNGRSVRRNRSLSNKAVDDYLNEKALKSRNVLHGVRTRRGYNAMNLQKKNQDAYFAFPNFMNNQLLHLFGVCDGHGSNGERIAEFVAKNFPIQLEATLQQKAKQKAESPEDIAGFLLSQNLEMSIFQALERTVQELTRQDIDSYFSGTTLNALLIIQNNVFVCNVGDSRAVMASGKNFSCITELSEDHKPENEHERQRILSKGGRIEQMRDEDGALYGPLRVWLMNENLPGLAMTRSIGDMFGASIGITWRPSMVIKKLEPLESAILFVATDGVWEVAENHEVLLEAKLFWPDKNIEGGCDSIMNDVMQSWKRRNYDMIDDITFILVFYG